MASIGSEVYLRLAHIGDAQLVYNTLSKAYDNLIVEYLSAKQYGAVSTYLPVI
jgi:hypothetical protein